MKQFIVLIAIQVCLWCVCIVRAVEDCPAGFEFIEGIKNRCFYYYVDSTGNINTIVKGFLNVVEICKGKNAIVAEPKSREEGDAIYNFAKEKRNGSVTWVWINYSDIQDQASIVGIDDSVFVSSTYVASLSTMAKMPEELWAPSMKNGTNREKGEHCFLYHTAGVYDTSCTDHNSLVCETDAYTVKTLEQYIKFLDEPIAA